MSDQMTCVACLQPLSASHDMVRLCSVWPGECHASKERLGARQAEARACRAVLVALSERPIHNSDSVPASVVDDVAKRGIHLRFSGACVELVIDDQVVERAPAAGAADMYQLLYGYLGATWIDPARGLRPVVPVTYADPIGSLNARYWSPSTAPAPSKDLGA